MFFLSLNEFFYTPVLPVCQQIRINDSCRNPGSINYELPTSNVSLLYRIIVQKTIQRKRWFSYQQFREQGLQLNKAVTCASLLFSCFVFSQVEHRPDAICRMTGLYLQALELLQSCRHCNSRLDLGTFTNTNFMSVSTM